MDVDKIINTILKPYKPTVHFLKSFELIGNEGMRGKFQTKSDFYSVELLNHLSAIELQICLNQLIFAFAAKTGLLFDSETNEIPIDLSDIQKNNSYIRSITTNFKSEIDASKAFFGEIKLINKKEVGNKLLCQFSYSFSNNDCFGFVNTVLIE